MNKHHHHHHHRQAYLLISCENMLSNLRISMRFQFVLFCFVSFWLRIYVYIRFDGSEKIRKCYDLIFPFLKVIDGKSKFQTLTLGMKILSHLRRERTSESVHTRALKLQSDIYWQNAYAFMCQIGMNHSLQEIWKFTTGNTSTNENTENKASTTMASSRENANSIKSPKSQLSL